MLGERISSSSSKATILWDQGPTLMTSFTFVTSQKPYLQKKITFEVRASKYEFWQDTIQSIASNDKLSCIMSLNWDLFGVFLVIRLECAFWDKEHKVKGCSCYICQWYLLWTWLTNVDSTLSPGWGSVCQVSSL